MVCMLHSMSLAYIKFKYTATALSLTEGASGACNFIPPNIQQLRFTSMHSWI